MFIRRILLALGASINYLIPVEYTGNPPKPVPVLFVEPYEVETYCGHIKNFNVLACAEKNGILIMPNPCDYPEAHNVDSYARLMCHEKAHINGWSHD